MRPSFVDDALLEGSVNVTCGFAPLTETVNSNSFESTAKVNVSLFRWTLSMTSRFTLRVWMVCCTKLRICFESNERTTIDGIVLLRWLVVCARRRLVHCSSRRSCERLDSRCESDLHNHPSWQRRPACPVKENIDRSMQVRLNFTWLCFSWISLRTASPRR